MIKLCKKCAWRCKVVLYDNNIIMHENQCFIRIDSVMEFDPSDNGDDTCRFFEPRQSEKNKNPFAEAVKSIKERKKGGEE